MQAGRLSLWALSILLICSTATAAEKPKATERRAPSTVTRKELDDAVLALRAEIAELREEIRRLSLALKEARGPEPEGAGVAAPDLDRAVADGKPAIGMTKEQAQQALTNSGRTRYRSARESERRDGRTVEFERWTINEATTGQLLTIEFEDGVVVRLAE